MKKVLFVILLLVGNHLYSQTFKSLLGGIKDKLEKKVKMAATDIANTATDAVGEQIDNIVVVSQKKITEVSANAKNAVNSVANVEISSDNDRKGNARLANNSTVIKEADAQEPNIVPISTIENVFSQEYPLFYQSYISMQQNDPLIKNIIFGYKDKHKTICTPYPKTGTIFFDLYYFENSLIKEDRAIFDLYQMTGYIHHKSDFPTEKDPVKNNIYTFEYALNATKKFAEKTTCGPLRYSISVIERRVSHPDESSNPKDAAAKQVAQGSVYQTCVNYVANNCKTR